MSASLSSSLAPRTAARLAGASLLLMAVLAGIAFGLVFSTVYIPGDAAATAQAVADHVSLFRLGIMAWLLTLLLDVVVAWALYLYFRPAHAAGSLLTGWLRLIYSAMLGIAIAFQAAVLCWLGQPEAATMISGLLEAFQQSWSLGLILFGGHLCGLAWLVRRSPGMPVWLWVLLYIAGGSYVLVHAGHLLLPQLEAQISLLESVLALPMTVGELGLAVWLLVKGGKGQTPS